MYNFATLSANAVPINGTNEVETVSITGTPTGGTFTLTYAGETTAAIPYNATAGEVQAALQALNGVGVGDVACSGGPLPGTLVSVTFQGCLGGLDVTVMTASAAGLTGGEAPAVTIATTTPGVRGTYRGAENGCYLAALYGTLPALYENTGTRGTPTWSLVAVTED